MSKTNLELIIYTMNKIILECMWILNTYYLQFISLLKTKDFKILKSYIYLKIRYAETLEYQDFACMSKKN
jgi:hypothetical protein